MRFSMLFDQVSILSLVFLRIAWGYFTYVKAYGNYKFLSFPFFFSSSCFNFTLEKGLVVGLMENMAVSGEGQDWGTFEV